MNLEREGRQVEYKISLENKKSIYRAIVSFSNDIGGKIIVGIADNRREVKGLTESEIENGLEELPKGIYDTISPSCTPMITTEIIEGVQCLVINVTPGPKKPYYIKSEGIPKGVYTRIGAHNKRVSDDMLEDLVRESQRQFWDEQLTDFQMEDLDARHLESFYGKGWQTSLLRADGVLGYSPRGDERVTNGGIIYFHPKPNMVFPQAEVLFTQFEGETMDRAIRTIDFSGPLPQLISRVMAELKPYITLKEEVRGVRREVVEWIIPEIVLRESLLNALLHRKYSIMGAIKIAVFSDRIDIFSPGNFPGPVDLQQLGNGVSYTRNPRMRQLARKAGLVEKRGMGFYIILKACEENGNARPMVEEGGDYVKVTLLLKKSLKDQTSLGVAYDGLQAFRKNHSSLQPKVAAELLGVSINTARARLMELVHKGVMEKRGSGRGVTYYWVIND